MPTKNVTEERLSKFKNKGKDPTVSGLSIRTASFNHFIGFIFVFYRNFETKGSRSAWSCVKRRRMRIF